mmetsp:Transcript_30234/g.59375  ORF Transcript_30234/g.59375 Transcript_30234/m.59375 type:complete len:128 (-) Transcript_30234:571-954(-)
MRIPSGSAVEYTSTCVLRHLSEKTLPAFSSSSSSEEAHAGPLPPAAVQVFPFGRRFGWLCVHSIAMHSAVFVVLSSPPCTNTACLLHAWDELFVCATACIHALLAVLIFSFFACPSDTLPPGIPMNE